MKQDNRNHCVPWNSALTECLHLKNDGFNCVIYGFYRGEYGINAYPQDIKVSRLGILKDKEYIWKAMRHSET